MDESITHYASIISYLIHFTSASNLTEPLQISAKDLNADTENVLSCIGIGMTRQHPDLDYESSPCLVKFVLC